MADFCHSSSVQIDTFRQDGFKNANVTGGDGLVPAKKWFTVPIRGRGRPRPVLESILTFRSLAQFFLGFDGQPPYLEACLSVETEASALLQPMERTGSLRHALEHFWH